MTLTTDQKVDKLVEFLTDIYGDNILGDKPDQPKPPIVKPAEGTVKEGGWGAIANPNTWKVVKMRDYPDLFKIVDAPGKNVATNFTTEAIAEQYIKYFKSQWEQDDDPQENEPSAEEKPAEPTKPVEGGDGPYKMKAGSKEMASSTRGPTIRHYASGKDDDKTIEKNVKDIKAKNYQFLVDVKITSIEHNDTVSEKYGGTHMKSGWFDNTIDFESGQVGLGVEKKHPSADLEIVKGDKIGSILNKKIRIAGVYFKDQNKCEMWTNLGSGWKKNAEGVDVGKFNPKSEVNEAQLRIDGFDDVPEISRAVVQEIEV